MKQLTVINHNNQRVLLTAQLAESYGTESKIISQNFNRNQDRYTEGKHFIALQGDEKREFLDRLQIEDSSKKAAVLYLWTEKGAWMHAKSLNTDAAWSAYEALVDDYYIKQALPVMTTTEIIAAMANQAVELEQKQAEQAKRITVMEKKIDDAVEIMGLNPIDGRKKVTALLNKIAQSLGGGSSYQDVRMDSYQRLESRAECNLSIRQTNKRKKMALEGVAKSKIDKVSKLDVIFDDARLTEIYFAIVKEMSVQNKVDTGDIAS
ncbi:ORF6N domain-containing protein [Paenibacillus tianmuensis]|uniref:ORF6N domain-containing protein n=1 Tax=Paenibacillus tianmuensis TaxID=624147 RepID=A0A1G4Q924_9BACL|nr:ORF6N domain-containing protein [Paenibacillus tianmuensis]SCW41090.1 ORF6N domain-containing protein [Paenibacillus tianmuensis]